MPATIDESRLGTLANLFRDSISRYADRPAVESFGKRQTYAELRDGRRGAAVAGEGDREKTTNNPMQRP